MMAGQSCDAVQLRLAKGPGSSLRPSNSSDSAQTADGAGQQHAGWCAGAAAAGCCSCGLPSFASPAVALGQVRMDPSAAKRAIKEALAPMGPAELALVQEQLRQSRLARSQQPLPWGGDGCSDGSSSGGGSSANSPSAVMMGPPGGSATGQHMGNEGGGPAAGPQNQIPLVQQVAAALARGQVSAQDIMGVLAGLDPSLLQPRPQQPELPPWAVPPPQLQPQAHYQQHQQYQHQQQQQQYEPSPFLQQQQPLPMDWQHTHGPTATHNGVGPSNNSMSLSTPVASLPLPSAGSSRSQRSPAVAAGVARVAVRQPRRKARATPAAARVSVAAPYSAVLDSLQLPAPAALAAHAAAAASAAAAAAEASTAAAAAAAAAAPHPGSSRCKGRRSSNGSGHSGRRARASWGQQQLPGLLRSVSDSGAHDDLLSGVTAHPDLGLLSGSMPPEALHSWPQHNDPAGDMLHLASAQHGTAHLGLQGMCWDPQYATAAAGLPVPAPACAHAAHAVDPMALHSAVPAAGATAPPALQPWAAAAAAGAAEAAAPAAAAAMLEVGQQSGQQQQQQEVEGACAPPPSSLRARFLRLSPAVQADILRQLDELSAVEDELRGLRQPAEAEAQGPRRSGRARRARNWGSDTAFAAKPSAHSTSPTPFPTSPGAEEAQQEQQLQGAAPKRMRLDANSSSSSQMVLQDSWQAQHGTPQHNGVCGSGSPDVAGAAAAAGAADPLSWCPELHLPLSPLLQQQSEVQQHQQPRRRRGPRRTGPRASARKRMHRRSFKRGKPQRAPCM